MSLIAPNPPSASTTTTEVRPQPPREANPHLDNVGGGGVELQRSTRSYPSTNVTNNTAAHSNHDVFLKPAGGVARGNHHIASPVQRPYSKPASPAVSSVKSPYKTKRVFKVIIIGDAGVGKTCLSYRFCNGRFPAQTEATIGVDFRERNMIIDEELIRVQLWDTAGQERYRQSIVPHYYRNVNAVVFVYDCTSPSSFKALAHWINECKKHCVQMCSDDTPHILIGNKCDLIVGEGVGRVPTSDAQIFADENDMPLFETSALADSEADHVESIFMTLVHKLRHSKAMHVQSADERTSKEQKLLLKASDLNEEDEEQSSGCC